MVVVRPITGRKELSRDALIDKYSAISKSEAKVYKFNSAFPYDHVLINLGRICGTEILMTLQFQGGHCGSQLTKYVMK